MVCEGMYQGAATTIADIAGCYAGTLFGGDYTLFAFIFFIILAIVCVRMRLAYPLALCLAFSVVYMFDMIAGGSILLRALMVLLGFGMAILLVRGLLDYVREHQ